MSEQVKESILSKIGSILISLFGQTAVKQIIVSQLKRLAAKTDNEVDDQIVALIDSALTNTKDVLLAKSLYEKWSGKFITATDEKSEV